MAVVGSCRQKQTMFKPLCEIPNGSGDLGVDGIALTARRSGVVRFVQDQEAPGTERAQPIRQRARIGLIDQQTVRDEESRVRGPGVDPKPPLSANVLDVVLVEYLEMEAEAAVQFFPPLEKHRRGAGDDNVAHFLSQEQFAGDQPGLDRFSDAQHRPR